MIGSAPQAAQLAQLVEGKGPELTKLEEMQ